MFQQQVRLINNLLMALDALCIVIAAWISYILIFYFSRNGLLIEIFLDSQMFALSQVFMVLINNYVMGRKGLYSDSRPTNYLSLLIAIFQSILIDFIILCAFFFLLRDIYYISLKFFAIFTFFSFFFISLARILVQFYLNHFAQNRFHARHLLIVGDKKRGNIVTRALEKQLSWGHKITKHWILEEEESCKKKDQDCLDRFIEMLRSHPIDEVVFAIEGGNSLKLPKYLDICRKMGVSVRILPALWSPNSPRLSVETVQGIPFLTLQVNNFSATGLLYKRILDLIGGLIGTIIFLILYPFVALAIKLDSPGPVIFKQKRVGQHGRVFTLYKFRTMYEDAEKRKRELMAKNLMKGPMFKLKDDPRITRVGRFLRKTSLDEFPQFINVLKGEMSLVGTRPPTLEEVKQYDLWHYRRISIKPGITGLWQISGRNKIKDFNKIVELDCKYLENWRFRDDLKIILKTIIVVLQRKGAF